MQVSAQGLDVQTFRELVDMNSSLATLFHAASNPAALDEMWDRVFLLDGVAASLMVFVDDGEEFYAEIELVSGAWRGLQEVELHRAYVVLDDPAFSGRVLERAPRDPSPELILRNRRLLVAARLLDIHQDADGTAVPVLLAFDARPLR